MRSLVAVGIVLVLIGSSRADEIDKKALQRAHDFLKSKERGQDVLSFVHFGAKYFKHRYARTAYVNDGQGRRVKGHFALVYEYEWADDGETQLAFLCDARGNVYKVQVMQTNAIFQQPFALANLSIKIVGEALLEAFKKKMTEDEVRQVRRFIDNADAKGLMELSLRLRQSLTP